MKSAVAVLTYNRVAALTALLEGLNQHCAAYPLAIFDDCSQEDMTAKVLTAGKLKRDDQTLAKTLKAEEWSDPTGRASVFLGDLNLGVAGNANRALHWFNQRFSGYDHLCLLNDDLLVLGDFVKIYADGHQDLGVGLFCFYHDDNIKWELAQVPGKSGKLWEVKILKQITGSLMSISRACLAQVGYFDPRFGKYGIEHCDYTHRARQAGLLTVHGQPRLCLDLSHHLLAAQQVNPSLCEADRQHYHAKAEETLNETQVDYTFKHPYRPFSLSCPRYAGNKADDAGVPVSLLQGYRLLTP